MTLLLPLSDEIASFHACTQGKRRDCLTLLDLLPLRLFRAYASSIALPRYLPGSIPGPWLAVTGAGFAPARLRGIAKPQPLKSSQVRVDWKLCSIPTIRVCWKSLVPGACFTARFLEFSLIAVLFLG